MKLEFLLICILCSPVPVQLIFLEFRPASVAAQSAKIFVVPSEISLEYPIVQFQVKVNITDIELVGLQFKLLFNKTLVNCTSFTENLFSTNVPESEKSNIFVWKKVINNTEGYVQYAYTFGNLKRATDNGYAPMNIVNQTVATFVFDVIDNSKNYTSTLELTSVIAGDKNGMAIPITVLNGAVSGVIIPEYSIVILTLTLSIVLVSFCIVKKKMIL